MRNWIIAGLMLGLSACANLQWPDLLDVRDTTVKVSDLFGHGSGTIISKDLVVTAAHVVGTDKELDVEFYDGTKIHAIVEWVDDKSDAALLRLTSPAKYAAIIDCKPLEIGERVFTLGNPGIARFVLTEGIVAGTDLLGAQKAQMPDGMPAKFEPMVTVSINWEAGDSGAGVFDMKGRLRAIVFGAWLNEDRTQTNNGLATSVSVLPQCRG